MVKHHFLVKTGLYKQISKLSRPFWKIKRYTDFLKWVDDNRRFDHNDYFTKDPDYNSRFKLHKAVMAKYSLLDSQISYFEFGVAKGDMISYWVKNNSNPTSSFVGYDSFEGLPESWTDKEKGHFDTSGLTPDIDDKRVSFVKGWFQDSVANDLANRSFDGTCVFHLDADLFSSTLYVLFQIHKYLKVGDILIFDEFSSYEHEYRALEIFKDCMARQWKFRCVGGINNFRQVAFAIE